ncbi:ankyrin repeat-containing domain protein [Xylaria grammica]|nr:ankyrin repeat-containing domain protein [Xylaria grammica]
MDPLSVAASIAGLVTLADAVFRGVYKYCRAASDASDEIKELANRLQSLAGILHSLGILADALEQDGAHPTIQMTHISDATKLLGEIQTRLDRSKSRINSSKLALIQHSLKWPFTKTRTKELTDKLAQQQDVITLALHADSLSNLVKLLSNGKDMKDKLTSVQLGVENLQILTRVEIDAERQRILDFFLKVNPQPNLDTSIKLRHPGTGSWLTESLQFQQWIDTAGSKMWLSGIPGAGKTVLAGAVIQKALERGNNSPRVGVAFFFCDYKNEKATLLSNVLGAMVSQLARQNDQAFNELKEMYETLHPPKGLARDPDSDILQSCLEKMFQSFDQVILVVDGLDECGDNTDEVTQALADIGDYSTNVTMALASRDEYTINLKLQDGFTKIQIGARKEDILLYVASEIDRRIKDGRLRTSNTELKDEILTKLSNDADGMFRWVTCQLDYISGCPTDADRRAALKELPPTLDATYERMLRRINQGHPRARRIVQKCLQLIALRWYNWATEDLCHAISVPDTPNTGLEKHSMVTETEISLQCSSFIRKSEDGKSFEFSHFTVPEFLERKTLLNDHELAIYHLSELICNAAFVQQCLRYLQLRNFDHMPDLDKNSQVRHFLKIVQDFPFYYEAAFCWPVALRHSPQDPECLDLTKSLFHPRKSPSFISWAVQLCALHGKFPNDKGIGDWNTTFHAASLVLDSTFRTIHVAAALDLPEICEYLLEDDQNWNTVSIIGGPLEFSIGRTYCFASIFTESLEDILESDVSDWGYATHRPGEVTAMLRAADSFTQDTSVKFPRGFLIERAILSAITLLDFSPVSSLITMGWMVSDEEATKFEKSLTFMLRSYPHDYRSGPHTSKERLTASFLDLLTSLNKFRVFESDPGYRVCVTAWNAAVKLECDFVEDTTLMDSRITLSLEALIRKCEVAVSNDDVESMQRYLGDPRITSPEMEGDGTESPGYSLLRRSISSGAVKIAGLLIGRGCRVNKAFSDGRFPIHAACDCEEEMIRLLLKSGASHLERDPNGDSIWHWAATSSKDNTLLALLKLTGDEKIRAQQMQNNDGFTPLTLAIDTTIDTAIEDDDEEGGAVNVKLLLDTCGHDPLCWMCPGSPWDLAARSGSIAVINRLVESGIPLATIQEGQPTPLHVIREGVSKECVEFLLRLFPTANRLKYEGKTPLECFIYRCFEQGTAPHERVIELLVHEDLPSNQAQKSCTIWKYLCADIIGSKTLKDRGWLDELMNSIFLKCVQLKVIEAYEELTGQSAVTPLFSALMSNGLMGVILESELEEVIAHSNQRSASLAKETIEYTKRLINLVATCKVNNIVLAQNAGRSINVLLSKCVKIQLGNGFSILEEACRSLDCGERYGEKTNLDAEPAASYALERHVFEDIVNRTSSEQLNAAQLTEDGYLFRLAKKGYHSGSSWMIEMLVAKGLDPNKLRAGPLQMSPLCVCIENLATPAALSLLKLGADPTIKGSNASNAAHMAALVGNLEFLTSLLRSDRENPIPSLWQETTRIVTNNKDRATHFSSVNVLHIASLRGRIACIKFFLDNKLFLNADSTAAQGFNCLHFAALGGYTETIEYLHALGLPINCSADDGSLPIHFAVRNDHQGAVQTLIELGSATNRDGFGMTPQMYAQKLGYTDIWEYLEKQQNTFQIHAPENGRKSQRVGFKILLEKLELAIREGNLTTCEELGFHDVSMPSCGGCSPLIVAIMSRRAHIIHWLLQNHVCVLRNACQKHGGKSTLELAVKFQVEETHFRKILDVCLDTTWDLASLGDPILESVWRKDYNRLSLMVAHVRQNLERYSVLTGHSQEFVLNYMINKQKHEDPLLHEASYYQQSLGVVDILLDAGADVDLLSDLNLTALQLATDSRVIDRLVAAGAKSGWIDSISWACVANRMTNSTFSGHLLQLPTDEVRCHWATRTRNLPGPIRGMGIDALSLHPKALCLLLQHNIDINLIDHSDRTFIHSALYDCQATSYLLSVPQIVDCKPFPWHAIGVELQKLPWINEHWRFFKRRIPFKNFQNMMNLHPEKGISPLCQAAAIDSLDIIDHCLEMGAAIDFDGSSYGSALMAACANCRLKAVKHLVRRGASIVYHGEFGLTSAIEMANGHKKIIAWLLVGQFTEQIKLEYRDADGPNNTAPIRHWSGFQQKPMRLIGYNERQPHQSLKDYIFKLAEIRDDMRGKALPLHRDPLAGLFNIVYYQI